MPAGTIIIINGASSSGKTSIIRALQDLLPDPYLEAGIDKFIFMMPKRYLDRPLWDDVLGLADHAGQAGRKLVMGMHRAVAALSQSGCNVLVDHVLVEGSWVRDCANLFCDLPAYLVGIQCPLEILEQREAGRKNRTLGQARLQYPVIHAYSVYDLEVNTALYSPQACSQQILEMVSYQQPFALRRLAGLPVSQ